MPSSTSTVRGSKRIRRVRTGMRFYRVRVTRIEQLSPSIRRIRFIGEGLSSFPFVGADQRIKLLLPQPDDDRPNIDGLETIWDLMALPDHVRPIMRTYTIRQLRPAASEVDIDFAVHDPGGPASNWAAAAQPGDEVALFGPAADYEPPEDTQWQLIAGDESALPAIGAIVESLRHYDRAQVFIEVADPRDAQELDSPADVEVTWLARGPEPARDSTRLLDAVRRCAIPDVPTYFWIAGEASVVTTIRRHLVNERGVNRDDVKFTGYWRHGRSENEPEMGAS